MHRADSSPDTKIKVGLGWAIGEVLGSWPLASRFILKYISATRSRFFFFSSRRRHTRLQGDWSSDVCSSDLSTLQDDIAAWIGAAQPLEAVAGLLQAALPLGVVDGGARPVWLALGIQPHARSEERRVGKEGRSRWAPDHLKKKKHEHIRSPQH